MKIWNVLWPLIIYAIAQIVVTLIGVAVFGMDEEYAVVAILAAALLCIPIYYRMYQKDGQDAQEEKPNIPMSGKDYFVIILCGATLAVAMNNLIMITPLPVWFPGYEETNEVIFGGGIWGPRLQLLKENLPNTELQYITYSSTDGGWREGQHYYEQRDLLGMYYMTG